MNQTTRVMLLTGFLGSGKTTLLNRLIDAAPPNKRLSILMNEFGEIGVDGQMLAGRDLDLWQVNRGSIFCACVKSDFIKGLAEITRKTRPDALIIEATGVADPTGLKRDLMLPLWKGRFKLVEQICLLDAANFLDAFQVFASLEKQIASSSRFILNKVDLAGPEVIRQVKQVVQEHHPSPEFIETSFAEVPLDNLLSGLFHGSGDEPRPAPPPSPQKVQELVGQLENFSSLDSLPPDPLSSQVFFFTGSSLEQLKDELGGLPAGVVRVKGYVLVEGRIWLVSYVMGDLDLRPMPKTEISKDLYNLLVVITRPGDEKALLNSGGVLRPCPW